MPEAAGQPFLRELLLFLVFAGVLIPLLQRFRVNPVLAFLALGTAVGPHGLAEFTDVAPWLAWVTIAREDAVLALAELGVVFLMFTIGLELSLERLWAIRRWVFGAGAAQVAASALAIGSLAAVFGHAAPVALVIGVALAFSSTAVVMQLLALRQELGSPLGRGVFSVLLFQDLMVVPLLILIGTLVLPRGESLPLALGYAVAKALLFMALIYIVGSRLIRPLFRFFAVSRQPDVFTALTLLSTLGISALSHAAGLSMALGAFLAGLLLSETEYRHEVEITIEPFKGLLLGLFFMTVGMAIDPGAVLAEPLWLLLSVIGLYSIKAVIAGAVLRLAGLPVARAVEAGALLGQGGEFAFIALGAMRALGLIDAATAQFMLLVVGLSLFATPLLARAGHALALRWAAGHPNDHMAPSPDAVELSAHVVIAGYGRVGQLLGQLLSARGVPFVALEADAQIVAAQRKRGVPIYYGDAARPELLRRVRLRHAAVVVLTMDHPGAALHAVQAIRRSAAPVVVLARARDETHALALREAGADAVIPETLESALQLAGQVLQTLGEPEAAVLAELERERERRIAGIRAIGGGPP